MKKLFVTILLSAVCCVMFSQKLIESPRYACTDFDLSSSIKDSLEYNSFVRVANSIIDSLDDTSTEEMTDAAMKHNDEYEFEPEFMRQYLTASWSCYRPWGPEPKNTELIQYLTDFYNASTLQRAVCSDFDDIVTFAEDGMDLSDYGKSVKSFECEELRNPKLDNGARKLIHTYQKAFSGKYDEEQLDQLYESFIAFEEDNINFAKKTILKVQSEEEFSAAFEIYNNATDRNKYIKNYEEVREIMDSATFQNYLLAASQSKTDYDLRCLYLIDCVHYNFYIRNNDDELLSIVLEQTLLDGQYSIFLYNLWNQWRCNKQLAYGGMLRRSSVIFNETYNMMRAHVADVLIRHIDLHPDDTAAIIQFLLLADNSNIVRNYSDWSFTNSVMMEIE